MTIISPASGNAYARLVQGLQMEFGHADVGALARQILDAERADFHWDARVRERYLGQHLAVDRDDDEAADELARIAIMSFLDGRWHAGICLVDGDGCATDLLWLRSFDGREDAEESFARAR